MTVRWISANTKGVRYYEHGSRLYKRNKDKYFAIRYKLDGKNKQESLGWESEGWTLEKVISKLHELKENQKLGKGPRTLAEKRELSKKEAVEKKKTGSVKLTEIFKMYLDAQKLDKDHKTQKNEIGHFHNWIIPILGNISIDQITPLMIEKMKEKMKESDKAASTISGAMCTISQMINFAKKHELYSGDNPISKVKKPKEDNRRQRFLTQEEADKLLDYLKENCLQTYEMAFISLHTGFRAKEVFGLKWEYIDFDHDLISAKDKNGKFKTVILSGELKEMLLEKRGNTSNPYDLLFLSSRSKIYKNVPDSFSMAVESLGLNNNLKDSKYKCVFHTLRHTYASWLVMSGVDVYTAQKLMGHKTISMTERYSHLAPDHLKKAICMFEKSIKDRRGKNFSVQNNS